MKGYRGISPYPGFAIGPAKVVSTWGDLVAIGTLNMPAIVVAPYLDERMVDTIDLQRVYGLVCDHGSVVDPLFDQLTTVKRPAIIGCRGIYEDARDGDLVAIDGEDHAAFLRPEGQALDYYRAKKGLRCRREPADVMSVVQRFADAIRMARLSKGWMPPFDLEPADHERLFSIARRVCQGEAPAPDDDRFVRSLIEVPRPPPDDAIDVEVVK